MKTLEQVYAELNQTVNRDMDNETRKSIVQTAFEAYALQFADEQVYMLFKEAGIEPFNCMVTPTEALIDTSEMTVEEHGLVFKAVCDYWRTWIDYDYAKTYQKPTKSATWDRFLNTTFNKIVKASAHDARNYVYKRLAKQYSGKFGGRPRKAQTHETAEQGEADAETGQKPAFTAASTMTITYPFEQYTSRMNEEQAQYFQEQCLERLSNFRTRLLARIKTVEQALEEYLPQASYKQQQRIKAYRSTFTADVIIYAITETEDRYRNSNKSEEEQDNMGCGFACATLDRYKQQGIITLALAIKDSCCHYYKQAYGDPASVAYKKAHQHFAGVFD